MRITKTQDGRYVKVLSPEIKGILTRIQNESQARRKKDEKIDGILSQYSNAMSVISSQLETMLVRYAEVSEILRKLFPEDELFCFLGRPLHVSGYTKSDRFIASATTNPPLEVISTMMVENLNVEYLGGKTREEIQAYTDALVDALKADLLNELAGLTEESSLLFAPYNHVNAAGPGVHPAVTYDKSGFMSGVDKKKLDGLELPGGIVLSEEEPENPKMMQVWIDLN
jgi:hypothetical protein